MPMSQSTFALKKDSCLKVHDACWARALAIEAFGRPAQIINSRPATYLVTYEEWNFQDRPGEKLSKKVCTVRHMPCHIASRCVPRSGEHFLQQCPMVHAPTHGVRGRSKSSRTLQCDWMRVLFSTSRQDGRVGVITCALLGRLCYGKPHRQYPTQVASSHSS